MRTTLFILFMLFTFNLYSQTPTYVPSNGLIGWWPFSGNADDQSGNGNNGAVTGAVLNNDRFGNANMAYSFDGIDDKIELGLQQSNVTAYSISGWFKTLVGGPILAGRGLSSETGLTLHVHNAATGVTDEGKALFVADGDTGPVSLGKITDLTYIDDNWHHIVGIYNGSAGALDASQFQIYIDNKLVPQSNSNTGSANAPLNNNTNILIGAHQVWPSGNVFNGKLDDIGVWNRALTPEEVSDLYNGNICYQNITVTDELVINFNALSFDPVTYENSISVWPNPTNDKITIDINNITNLNGYQIKIVNTLGQEVFQTAVNQQQFEVDLNSWTGTGLYFLSIIDGYGNVVTVRKIILQ